MGGNPGGPPNGNPLYGNPQAAILLKPLKESDIGYFNPDFSDDNCDPVAPVVSTKYGVYYRDIYIFYTRLEDVISQRGEAAVLAVLSRCLKGTAVIWQSAELSGTELEILRVVNL